MNPRQKKLILAAAALVLIGALAAFLLSRQQPAPDDLQAGDFTAANIQHAAELNQSGANELVFFSGTALAKLNLSDTSGAYLRSESLTEDIPFEKVDRIHRGSSVTIVRAYYHPEDSLLPLDQTISEGWKWFSIDSESRLALLPFEDHDKVADCIIEGDTVYALIQNASNTQNLVQLTFKDQDLVTVVGEHPATSFVGASKDILLLRDYDGNIYARVADEQTLRKVAENVGEALFDPQSGKLITSAMSSVEEEHETAKTEQTLTVLALKDGTKKTITTPAMSFFVNRGYLILPNAVRQPTSVKLHDLETGTEKTINIDQTQTKVNNPIAQIIVVRDDLSVLGVVTSQNFLQLYGRPSVLTKLPVYALPVIDDTREDYIFDYDVVSSQLGIYAYDESPGLINNSLAVLEQTCECDVNQVAKYWGIVPLTPGL